MKGNKGQASIEFLLTLLVALLFIITIVQPAADRSIQSMTDTTNFAKLTLTAEKIVNAIEYVSLGAEGTKTTMQAIIPKNSTFECPLAMRTIKISYNSTSPIEQCTTSTATGFKSTCEKTIKSGAEFTCVGTPAWEGSPYTATIEKTSTEVTVTFT